MTLVLRWMDIGSLGRTGQDAEEWEFPFMRWSSRDARALPGDR